MTRIESLAEAVTILRGYWDEDSTLPAIKNPGALKSADGGLRRFPTFRAGFHELKNVLRHDCSATPSRSLWFGFHTWDCRDETGINEALDYLARDCEPAPDRTTQLKFFLEC